MNPEMILLICVAAAITAVLILIIAINARRSRSEKDTVNEIVCREIDDLRRDLDNTIRMFDESTRRNTEALGSVLKDGQSGAAQAQERQIAQMRSETRDDRQELRDSMRQQLTDMDTRISGRLREMDERMSRMSDANSKALEAVNRTVSEGMAQMREENSKKLEEIRGTVDEKLQSTLEKRINESFKSVSEQLEKVYKGLGEMQTLANDVGGLKKVLSGVKTRGILGEVRLGAILEEILTAEQYETNIATVPGSSERVEFAVKLPGTDGRSVYLPIDSKFPGERYQQLLDAQESGDKNAVEAAYRELNRVVAAEAKDISEKYIRIPYTTSFGIMFLPFEGLYAEVVSHGMLEKLQRDYNVNVAGPSTIAALLNSLQMGFKTLAIQRHSHEIYDVLLNVQNEFGKFGEVMKKMQDHLRLTSDDLEKLMGTRTNSIRRQLDKVQSMDDIAPVRLADPLLPPSAGSKQ